MGLQVLNLSLCGFSSRVPSSLGSLMRLTMLDLSKQNLSSYQVFRLWHFKRTV